MDFMLDLETMGVGTSPAIMQIAVVPFNLDSSEEFEDEPGIFDSIINLRSCTKAGLDFDGDTFQWWLSQDVQVFEKIVDASLHGGDGLSYSLGLLTEYFESFGNKGVYLWGNGIRADCVWLASAYNACGLTLPWSYNGDRDVRTLVDIGGRLFPEINPKYDIPFEGSRHDALSDCKHQIKYVQEIFKKIKGVSS